MQQGIPVFFNPFTQTYTYVGGKKALESKILQRSTMFHSLQLWLNPYSSHSFARAKVSPGDSKVERCMRTNSNSRLALLPEIWVQEFFWQFSCAYWANKNYCFHFLYIKRRCTFTATELLTPNLFGTNLRIRGLSTSTFSRQVKLKEVLKSIMLAILDRNLPKVNYHTSQPYYQSTEAQTTFFKVIDTMIKLSDSSIIQ